MIKTLFEPWGSQGLGLHNSVFCIFLVSKDLLFIRKKKEVSTTGFIFIILIHWSQHNQMLTGSMISSQTLVSYKTYMSSSITLGGEGQTTVLNITTQWPLSRKFPKCKSLHIIAWHTKPTLWQGNEEGGKNPVFTVWLHNAVWPIRLLAWVNLVLTTSGR